MKKGEAQRKWRAKPENREKERIRSLERYYNDPRVKARFATRQLKLEKRPCAMCGSKKTEIHHLSYTDPEFVIWFCPECHRRLHKEARKKKVIL